MDKKWLDMTEKQMLDEVDNQIMALGAPPEKQQVMTSALDRLAQSQPAIDKLKDMAKKG